MKCAHVLIVAFSISSLGCEPGLHPSESTGGSTGAESWESSDGDIETDQVQRVRPHTESGSREEPVDEEGDNESPGSESGSPTPDEPTPSDEGDLSDISIGESSTSGDESSSSTMTGAANDPTGETDDVSAIDPDVCFDECTQGPLEAHLVDTEYCEVYEAGGCMNSLCKSTANQARYIAVGHCWKECGEPNPDDGSMWDEWSIESELNRCMGKASATVNGCLLSTGSCADDRLAIGACTRQLDELLEGCEREANEQG